MSAFSDMPRCAGVQTMQKFLLSQSFVSRTWHLFTILDVILTFSNLVRADRLSEIVVNWGLYYFRLEVASVLRRQFLVTQLVLI